MSKQDYFRNALSDFTYETASGGAIRHLADLGYTVRQICDRLTYPTPYERVRRTVWQHLIDTKVVLTEEPGSGREQGKKTYTVAHNKYGRASFRLEKTPAGGEPGLIRWKELRYSEQQCGSLAVYLAEKCSANGENAAYISCDFGLQGRRDKEKYEEAMQALNERQREYISGLLWEEKTCYHRLDRRMREIVVKLYAASLYQGYCFFLKSGEKVELIL